MRTLIVNDDTSYFWPQDLIPPLKMSKALENTRIPYLVMLSNQFNLLGVSIFGFAKIQVFVKG